MALKLHNLKPAKGAKKRRKRVGRGDSSGVGSYSRRGIKGQRSRSGGKGGLKLKGLKANIQSMPKMGGFKSHRPKLAVVNLNDLEKKFKDNELVTPIKMARLGLIKSIKPGVKVLGMGKINKKLTIKSHKISLSAQQAVEKAGGKVVLLTKPKDSKKDQGKTDTKKDKEEKKPVAKETAKTKKSK